MRSGKHRVIGRERNVLSKEIRQAFRGNSQHADKLTKAKARLPPWSREFLRQRKKAKKSNSETSPSARTSAVDNSGLTPLSLEVRRQRKKHKQRILGEASCVEFSARDRAETFFFKFGDY